MAPERAVAPERSDTACGRAAIVAAAAVLFERGGVEAVSMENIAEAAGVGRSTVLSRVGDRAALIHAVLAPRAAALRERIEEGPAPLGPGGEPVDALNAYLDALLEFVWTNRALIRTLEDDSLETYYTSPLSEFWIGELARRLAATRPGGDADADAEYLAHVLFPALRANAVDYLVSARGMPLSQVRAGLHRLVAV